MAQKRRKELMMRRRQRQITALCIAGGLGAVLLSLLICLIVFDIRPAGDSEPAAASTALPYDAATPFGTSDLTSAQLTQLRTVGRMRVSDGPRGISVGDSLDALLAKFPSQTTRTAQSDRQAGQQSDEEIIQYVEQASAQTSLQTAEQTGEQSDEEIILYCADYFENQNGIMTALPPRGLLTVDSGSIIVTLLAPTSAYPAGTQDNYGSFEHVYCVFTIEPDTMTVSAITLGIDQ